MRENQKINVKWSEILCYLEEMIISDLATKIEEKVYQDIKWFGRYEKKELNEVIRNMKKW